MFIERGNIMRLQKYMAHCGVSSRRKAEEIISEGRVTVNGINIDQMGYVVHEGDVVEVDGNEIHVEGRKVYVLLNKPEGYITSVSDEQNRPTVLDLVSDIPERVFPVGRLDFNTKGLLILTNDGDLSFKLTHPKHEVRKTYVAKVTGQIKDESIDRLEIGIDIGDYITSKAEAKLIKKEQLYSVVKLIISEGKNRQVRRMFKAVGNEVIELQRVAIGKISIGDLKEGTYRHLTKEEVKYLKSF